MLKDLEPVQVLGASFKCTPQMFLIETNMEVIILALDLKVHVHVLPILVSRWSPTISITVFDFIG